MAAAPLNGILITGSSGQVGSELVRACAVLEPRLGPVNAPQRAELDLADPASIVRVVRALRPRWILNAAAYTAVDRAGSEPEVAYAINAEAVRILGEEAAALGTAVLHFSTDYVFDGTASHPYTEQDATNPQSVYGASKLAGEQALARSGARHLIFRTSWVYGASGHNFLRTILRLARERSELKVVSDQHGTPTASSDLAALVVHVLSRDPDLRDANGLYHATGAGETTWFGFAAEILRRARTADPATRLATLQPTSTAEYAAPARRPANSRLDCSRLAAELHWIMPPWQDSLAAVMQQLPELAGLQR